MGSEDDDLAIMEKQIATCSSSGHEERSGSIVHQSPMHPDSPVEPPSWEHHAEPTPTPPVSPDRNTFTPSCHSSVTPEPSPPPRLRCGGRYNHEPTHPPKDVGSPLTDIGDNDNEDDHTGAVQKGSSTRTHRKAKVPRWVPAASNEDPAKKKGKKPRK